MTGRSGLIVATIVFGANRDRDRMEGQTGHPANPSTSSLGYPSLVSEQTEASRQTP
jgi:hypothetical protein